MHWANKRRRNNAQAIARGATKLFNDLHKSPFRNHIKDFLNRSMEIGTYDMVEWPSPEEVADLSIHFMTQLSALLLDKKEASTQSGRIRTVAHIFETGGVLGSSHSCRSKHLLDGDKIKICLWMIGKSLQMSEWTEIEMILMWEESHRQDKSLQHRVEHTCIRERITLRFW